MQMKKSVIAICSIILVVSIAVPLAVFYPSLTPAPPRTLNQDVTSAIQYLKTTDEPYILLDLNVMYRRFGVSTFSGALAHYDQILAENPYNSALLRIYRRMAVHDTPINLDDYHEVIVGSESDSLVVPALYYGQVPLPSDYYDQLHSGVNSDDKYLLTHALMAIIWIQENGGPEPDFANETYSRVAALIDVNSPVTDLELEGAAFLYIAGHGDLVSQAFIDKTISAQKSDGSWVDSSTPESVQHTTMLGLMLLLHIQNPSDNYPPMLAPA
jgi:hypothetical protein